MTTFMRRVLLLPVIYLTRLDLSLFVRFAAILLIGCECSSSPQLANSSGKGGRAQSQELAINFLKPIDLTTRQLDEECEVARRALESRIPLFAEHERSILILQAESAGDLVAGDLSKRINNNIDKDAVKKLKDANKEDRNWPPDLIKSRRLHIMDALAVMKITYDENEWQQIQKKVPACGIIRISRPGFDANHERALIWWEFNDGGGFGGFGALEALQKTGNGWQPDGIIWTSSWCPF